MTIDQHEPHKRLKLSNDEDTNARNASDQKKASLDKSKDQAPATRLENGRMYTCQENVGYILPKDVAEINRLNKQHLMLKMAFNGNFEAPIGVELEKGIVVLDSGCGPGTWMFDVAGTYPESYFHGVDVAPVFPMKVTQKNCEFHLANLNEPLPFPDNHFDYIHQRLLVAGLTSEGWKKTLRELFRVLKPGGWIELKESQLYGEHKGLRLSELSKISGSILESSGMYPKIASELRPYLEKSGFKDIRVTEMNIPLKHGGIIGSLNWEVTQELLESVKPSFFKSGSENYKDDTSFYSSLDMVATECSELLASVYWAGYIARKPFI